jgi:Flp pilus assembly pilin Flp
MNFPHSVKRLFVSEDGATNVEYVVMVSCIIVLCLSVFRVATTIW